MNLPIILSILVLSLIAIKIKDLNKQICGLCGEHHKWAKRVNKPCDCYGCIYHF